MHLDEYQSRQCFSRFGIPTIPGNPANSPGAGIVVAHYFLGMYADRGNSILLVASADSGGISPVERGMPERLVSETINPFLGVLEFQARNLANGINLPRDNWSAFVAVAQNLFRCFVACDAVRAEINPLGLTPGGDLFALGGELMIDDNALFRQPELVASQISEAERESAALARAAGLAYVRLGGTIGCAVSGAGLGLATLDMLARNGCGASCLLDMGSINRETISAALRLILPDSAVGLFNIFADRASCTEVAQEFLAVFADTPLIAPLVIRLAGRDAEHGLSTLEAANVPRLIVAAELSDAVRLVAAAAKGYTDVNLSR